MRQCGVSHRFLVLLCIILLPSIWALSSRELEEFKRAVVSRPNFVINGILFSKLELIDGKRGVVTFKTNARPGYIDPKKSGYPAASEFTLNIPRQPVYKEKGTCIPTGSPVGMTIFGTLIFSVSLPEPGCPQADERTIGDGIPGGVRVPDWDNCGGRVEEVDKLYRVYTWSSCLETLSCGEPSRMIGVAMDGFPIYGPIDDEGRQVTTSDLDECHGKFDKDGNYRYHATIDYPYFISCFKGTVRQDSGIDMPLTCTCPFNDTVYIEPSKLPFPNYKIAFQWSPIYRNISLYSCQVCQEVRRYTSTNSASWLNYNALKQSVQVCNMSTEQRFTEVIKRRLIQGRLPPDMEYEFLRESIQPDMRYYNDKMTAPSEATSAGDSDHWMTTLALLPISFLWILYHMVLFL